MKKKDDYIGLRISTDERLRYERQRLSKGYRNLSEFTLVLFRKFYKKVPKKPLTIFIFCLLLISPAEAYTTDQWADAIFKAEGGYSASYLYGIRSVPYKDEAEARQICKNTVYNTLVKYRNERCPESGDIDCIANRYAPIGADNDPKGLNKNWKKNVLYFLTNN